MIEPFKKAMVVALAIGALLSTGIVTPADADDVYGSSILREITIAMGTGDSTMANSIQMVVDPRGECWNKCRGQGGLKSECRKKCGIPPEG